MRYSNRNRVQAFALVLVGGWLLLAAARGPWDGKVTSYGALRAMFHEGKTAAAVDLETLLPNPALYGVGARAELAGEITIVGGIAYRSMVDRGSVRTETEPAGAGGAALLVTAEVASWQGVKIDTPIAFEQLDVRIGQLAEAHGLDPGGRFPFTIEGPVTELRWHVIDGSRLQGGGGSHGDHLAASQQGAHASTRATIVGFYSAVDQGVFTHMGSKTHLHAVLDEPLMTGHIDHVVLPAGTQIRFPRIEQP